MRRRCGESACELARNCQRRARCRPQAVEGGGRHDAECVGAAALGGSACPHLLQRCDRSEPENLGLTAVGEPLRVDPAALSAAGSAVAGVSNGVAAAVGTLTASYNATPGRMLRGPRSASHIRTRPER
ncbi:hypothetical protein MHPYR_120164 [uncultured Mycobacterium sp.]|uniref:Uncharacterized protein n=1 Tax=uncultured Mycobacterium sp. TaxID=171292 RepID=A0A1Y5P037_9MYCO|nr:hypothetical protein MHPYR_120164 [uncultured Mycobacterium sp.]